MTLNELFVEVPAPMMIFAGAGASAPLGCPVMADFLARARAPGMPLSEYRDADQLFARLRALCTHGKGDPDDLEDLLDTARELVSLTPSQLQSAGKLWSLHHHDPATLSSQFEGLVTQWRPQVTAFISRAQGAVYRLCRNVAAKAVAQAYGPLLAELRRYTEPPALIPVFTTNYDRALDVALREECEIHRYWDDTVDGFSPSTLGLARDWVGFNRVQLSQGVTAIYAKLHGSLNWRKVHEGAEVTDLGPLVEQESDDPSKPNIIMYPGRPKAGLHDRVFDELHRVLEAALARAKVCVVIGYANRDDRIAGLFQTALQEHETLHFVVVDPAWGTRPPGGFATLPEALRHRLHPVRERFGTPECSRAVAEALLPAALAGETLG